MFVVKRLMKLLHITHTLTTGTKSFNSYKPISRRIPLTPLVNWSRNLFQSRFLLHHSEKYHSVNNKMETI